MMPAEGWMMSSLRPSNIIQVESGSEKICVKLARVDPGYSGQVDSIGPGSLLLVRTGSVGS